MRDSTRESSQFSASFLEPSIVPLTMTEGDDAVRARENDVDEVPRGLVDRFSHLIRPWARHVPERTAIVDGSTAWSYRELAKVVDEVAEFLKALDIRPGDRVMTVSEANLALVALLLAASELDLLVVVADPCLSDTEIDQIRSHSDPRRTFYVTHSSPRAKEHAVRHAADRVQLGRVGAIAVSSLNTRAKPASVHPSSSKQVAVVTYIPLTARDPKSVMLSHRELLLNARIFGETCSLCPSDQLFTVLPFSHSVGLSHGLISGLMFGCAIHLVPRYDAASLVQAIADGSVSVLYGPASVYQELLDFQKIGGFTNCPRGLLRHIAIAGAPPDPGLRQSIEALFSLQLRNGYNVSDCAWKLLAAYGPVSSNRTGGNVSFSHLKSCSDAGNERIGRHSLDASTVGKSFGSDQRLRSHLARLRTVSRGPTMEALEFESIYLSLIRDVCEQFTDEHEPSEKPRRPSRIRLICDLIEARYDEALSLDELSDLSGLDKFKLIREFKRAYGISPHSYLNIVRIRHARDRILGGGELADIAAAVGFSDQSHMTRAFRSTVGYTPGALAQMSVK